MLRLFSLLIKTTVVLFVLALGIGITYIAVTDVAVKQTEVTKTIDPQGVINDQ